MTTLLLALVLPADVSVPPVATAAFRVIWLAGLRPDRVQSGTIGRLVVALDSLTDEVDG